MVWIPQTHWTRQTGTPKKKSQRANTEYNKKEGLCCRQTIWTEASGPLMDFDPPVWGDEPGKKKTQWNLKPRSYKLPFMWCCISHHFFISLLGLYHINKVLIYYYIFTASKCPVLAMCLKCAVILVFKFTHMHKDKEQPIARKSLEADALKRVKSKYGGAEGGFKRLQCTSSFFFVFFKYFVFNETFYTPC